MVCRRRFDRAQPGWGGVPARPDVGQRPGHPCGPGHPSHRSVRRFSQAYNAMTTATMTTMPSARTFAKLAWPRFTSEISAPRICSGDKGVVLRDQRRGRRVGGERVGEQQQGRSEERRGQQRAGNPPPEHPGRPAEGLGGLPPLWTHALHRRQEHQHHQRDLEVRVDQREAPEPVQPLSVRLDAEPGRQQSGDGAVAAEGGDERESQHDAAELGQHRARGGDDLADEGVAGLRSPMRRPAPPTTTAPITAVSADSAID